MSEQTPWSVTGNPTDDELAALVVAMASRASAPPLRAAADKPLAGGWNSYRRTVRTPLVPGPDAWRTWGRL